MCKEQRNQELELIDCEVRTARRLSTFSARNTNAYVCFHDHRYVISAVANRKCAVARVLLANHFYDVSLLPWRYATS